MCCCVVIRVGDWFAVGVVLNVLCYCVVMLFCCCVGAVWGVLLVCLCVCVLFVLCVY